MSERDYAALNARAFDSSEYALDARAFEYGSVNYAPNATAFDISDYAALDARAFDSSDYAVLNAESF